MWTVWLLGGAAVGCLASLVRRLPAAPMVVVGALFGPASFLLFLVTSIIRKPQPPRSVVEAIARVCALCGGQRSLSAVCQCCGYLVEDARGVSLVSCRACRSPVRSDALVCRYCQSELPFSPPRLTSVPEDGRNGIV
jgi:hypothetical protein